MLKRKVLVIEDESRIAHWVQSYFERAGYEVVVAGDGVTGLQLARQGAPDLIILDLMLPQMDGMTVCRTLRGESDVPIIMLTARGSEDDRVLGLDSGADDYAVKPFTARELVARANALLRRSGGHTQQVLRGGEIELDVAAHSCTINGQAISLSPTQFAILEMLMRHPNQVISREKLMDAAFGDSFAGLDRNIDTHIRRLRQQIEPDTRQPRYVQTVYGVGYKFAIAD
jgi:DNA-binding response OmpR family regulator